MAGFEGTGALVRLGLRRDRVRLVVWVSLVGLLAASTAGATVGLYPTVASRVEAATAINESPSLVALYGPILDPRSLGALSMLKMVNVGAAMVAVLTIMLTVRHSRAEEETGRLELLGAAVVGRLAPLTAALAIAAVASVALGVSTGLGLVASGLPAGGSLAFGASWAGVGMAFAAAAAVAAQLARTARNATGLTVGFLGLAYVLRAVGDTTDGARWLTWLSPLGWGHRVAAFAGDRWVVLLLPTTFVLATTAVAYGLAVRRDLGAGLFEDRPGPATAGPRLHSVLGLAWRLERGTLLAWTAAFALSGLLMGSMAGDVGSIVSSEASQDFIRRLGGAQGLSDAYLAAVLGVLGVVAAAYGVHATLRLRAEEAAGQSEAVLATGVARVRWAGSHLLVAMAGATGLMLTAGLTAAAARALQTGRVADTAGVVVGALLQLPAVWVVIGIAVAAFGVNARYAIAGWIALTAFLVLGELGVMLDLPQRLLDVSPFTHVPRLPGSPLRILPVGVLLVVAAVLDAAGLAGFRRRDIG